MKYSILGFNQNKVLEVSKQKEDKILKLDLTDLVLLEYIQYAIASPSMQKRMQGEKCYVWLQHKKILEDLPILNIQENMLGKRISKLVDLGLIDSIVISNSNIRGSKSYYTITEQCEYLIYESESPVINYGWSLKSPVINYGSNNKLEKSISKDIDLEDKKDISQKPIFDSEKGYDRFVRLYHEHCPDLPKVRALTDKRKRDITKLIKKYGWDDIITVLDLTQASDFLKHGAGDGGWNGANIDFILREDKFLNILEGKYGGKKKKKSNDGLVLAPRATKEDRDEYKYRF